MPNQYSSYQLHLGYSPDTSNMLFRWQILSTRVGSIFLLFLHMRWIDVSYFAKSVRGSQGSQNDHRFRWWALNSCSTVSSHKLYLDAGLLGSKRGLKSTLNFRLSWKMPFPLSEFTVPSYSGRHRTLQIICGVINSHIPLLTVWFSKCNSIYPAGSSPLQQVTWSLFS